MKTNDKTLADVQPGGRVRLGDLPKDGEVLVEVSGLTGSGKSAIAGEIEILCKALGLEVEWVNGDEEKRLTHADWIGALEMYKPKVVIVEQNIPRAALSAQPSPATCKEGLQVQPSPGGQGGLNYERMFVDACAALAEVSRELGCDPEQGGAEPILAAIAELREALAARQPVGQIVGYMDPNADFMLARPGDCVLMGNIVLWREPGSKYTKPLYDAPPAQAVDLGAVREAVRKAWQKCAAGESVDRQFGTLLALIDSKADGNG